MKTKTNYLNVLKEIFILTVAVAIIAAAVFLFQAIPPSAVFPGLVLY